MKIECILFALFSLCLSSLVLSEDQIAYEMEDRILYDPGSWLPYYTPQYAYSHMRRDTLSNSDIEIYGRFPWIGYPSRPAILPGLNDTLQFAVLLSNRTDKPFLLTDKNVEEWFVPQVFGVEQDIYNDTPIVDKDSLKFELTRIQGNPDTLTANSWDVSLVYDVWNLPSGTYRLVAKATDRIPAEFIGRTTGSVYMMKERGDLADSINVLESFYLRHRRNEEWKTAMSIADSILSLDKYSVVGWGLKKDCCWKQGEFGCAIAAIDSALRYLTEELDPAAPTPKERKEDEQAQAWYDHLIRTFESERAFIGG